MEFNSSTLARAGLIDRLISKCRTGNPLVDTALSLALLDSGFVQRIGQWLSKRAPHLFWQFIYGLIRLYRYVQTRVLRRQPQRAIEYVTKTCHIRSITPEMEINTVFSKIQWYLRQQTVLDDETNVNIQQAKDDMDLAQTVPVAHEATIRFQGVDIKYKMTSEVITIHADRNYQRQVHLIDLVAKRVPKQNNIFMELARVANEEHQKAIKELGWTQCVYRNTANGTWEIYRCPAQRRMETICLKTGQMEELCHDFDDFLASEQWYLDRDVPYTHGYLFYGDPGTGKSSTAAAFAARGKRDIHYLMLSSVASDDQLVQLMKQINLRTTILVIEDIDCASRITHARSDEPAKDADAKKEKEEKEEKKNDAKEDELSSTRLTLSGLLQVLDCNLVNAHGRITIMTTNRAHVLDAALVRAGRVDMKIEFSHCDTAQVEHLYQNFFNEAPPTPLEGKVDGLSPAEVTGLFVQHKREPHVAWRKLCQGYEPPDQKILGAMRKTTLKSPTKKPNTAT